MGIAVVLVLFFLLVVLLGGVGTAPTRDWVARRRSRGDVIVEDTDPDDIADDDAPSRSDD
jgi:Na+-transporting methylmalonyl-CoA/oxaloacetate decarboxylase gamma subunit